MPKAVEAEVMESADVLAVKSRPGDAIVIVGFDAIKERVGKIVAEYEGVEIPKEYASQAKKDRAYLNGIAKSIDQRRLEVKRAYEAPVKAFEELVKELTGPIKQASDALDVQIKAFEESDKATKKQEIREHWYDFAGPLSNAVDFELVFDPKWLNKGCNVMTAFEEVESIAQRIPDDEATLTEMNLSHPLEAKAELFATIDLRKAIARSKTLDEQEARAAKLEEEKQATLRWQQEQVAAAALRAQEAQRAAEANAPSEETPATVEAPSVDEVQPDDDSDGLIERTFVVRCTPAEFEGIIAYLKSVGVKGVARK